jgi:hypothetical protein
MEGVKQRGVERRRFITVLSVAIGVREGRRTNGAGILVHQTVVSDFFIFLANATRGQEQKKNAVCRKEEGAELRQRELRER